MDSICMGEWVYGLLKYGSGRVMVYRISHIQKTSHVLFTQIIITWKWEHGHTDTWLDSLLWQQPCPSWGWRAQPACSPEGGERIGPQTARRRQQPC